MPDEALIGFLFAALGALCGWIVVRMLARRDHETWVLARAPLLPIRALAVGDDAWVRGTARAAAPLSCPWFDVACVAYSYRRERKHVTVTTDKDGKSHTRTEWRTDRSEATAIDFELDDGDVVLVRAADATNEALVGLATDYEGSSLRHVASVIEVDATLSVLGVVQDDRSLAAEREVPCLWTRLPRDERVRRSARSETWLAWLVCQLPFLGAAGGMLWWLGRTQPGGLGARDWALAAAAGALLLLPFWGVMAWNRLVRLRQQVRAAFRQVDVDLAVRAGLVPNLVEVVRAYAAHEATLLRDTAALRSGRDRDAEHAARAVLVLHERYPDLRADALYRDLHERLWAVEEKLAHTRQLYNDIATEWNDRTAQFPQALVARLMRCQPAPLLAFDDDPLPPRLVG